MQDPIGTERTSSAAELNQSRDKENLEKFGEVLNNVSSFGSEVVKWLENDQPPFVAGQPNLEGRLDSVGKLLNRLVHAATTLEHVATFAAAHGIIIDAIDRLKASGDIYEAPPMFSGYLVKEGVLEINKDWLAVFVVALEKKLKRLPNAEEVYDSVKKEAVKEVVEKILNKDNYYLYSFELDYNKETLVFSLSVRQQVDNTFVKSFENYLDAQRLR